MMTQPSEGRIFFLDIPEAWSQFHARVIRSSSSAGTEMSKVTVFCGGLDSRTRDEDVKDG